MTQQEKALQLYSQYEQLGKDFTRGVSMKEFAKQCALIAVDELISSHNKWDDYAQTNTEEYYFWQEVKQEIEKL